MSDKVLVVDDEPFMVRLIQIVLGKDGYAMVHASNGSEAVEIARVEHPRLIIMDAMMPKMDGLTAIRLLKSDPATRDIPVVMLTANPTKFSKEDAVSSGATVFLTKPFSPMELLTKIRAIMSRPPPGGALSDPPATG